MWDKISKMLNRQDTLEKKLFWGLTILLSIVSLVAFIMTVVEYATGNLPLIAVIMAAFCVIPLPVIMVICKKTGATGKCYLAMTISMSAVCLPITFFANGGLISGMPIYCLAGIILCGFCMNPKYRIISFVAALVSCLVCFIVSAVNPELGVAITDLAFIRFDIITSFAITAVSMFFLYCLVLGEYDEAILRERKEAERKAEMRLELMNVQLENVADLKRIRHDVRHHNALILQYAENGDIEGLKRYIKQKMDTDEYYATKIYCMNAVINNILTVYTRKAQKEGITVDVSAEVAGTLNIGEPDLVAVLANAFENAIHGAMEVEEGEKRISVDVHSKADRLILKVSNTCKEGMELVGGFPTNRPGTGINSIMNAADRYDGQVSYKLNEGVLTCTVIMQMPGR